MYKITALGSEPKQQIVMQIHNNIRLVLNFEYKANQMGWFFGFEYDNKVYQNIRLTTSLNILRAYQAWLPFGIMCRTLDGLEPTDIDDFTIEYATIYILTPDEINSIESTYYVKVTPQL